MRILKQLLILMVAVCMIGGSEHLVQVHAAEAITVESPYGVIDDASRKWSIGLTSPNNAGWYSDSYSRLYIDGRKVYCVQPLVNVAEGASDYEPTDLETFTGSAETSSTLKRISALGYGYNGDTSDEMDFATQIRIWQEMNPGLITNIDPEIQEKIDEINSRLAVLETPVSFDHETVELKGYGKENDVTISDSNGYFSYYDEVATRGIHSEKNGNSLTIWAEKDDSLEDAATRYAAFGWTSPGTAIAYYSEYSQGVAYLSGGDPRIVTVNAEFTVDMILNKTDIDTEGRAQGDATFEGTTFVLTDDTTGEEKGTFTIAADGSSNTISGLAPNHSYSIHETAAGTGYKLRNEDVVISIEEMKDAVEDGVAAFDVGNDVITGQFNVKKLIANSHASDFVTPEEGAEFTAILKSYVTEAGSFDKAAENVKAGTSGLTEKEYDVVTTDANGEATSSDLAYGTYVIKQTDGDKELALMHPEFEFTVSGKDQPTINYTISNISKEYYVRVVKKDANSGKQVILTSAKFKIKDSDGNYVTQKVGSVTYDTFATTAKNTPELPAGTFYVDTEEEGTTVTPLTLMPGKYTLEEVDVPDGYVFAEEDLEFTLASEQVVEDEDPDEDFQTVELTVENEQPTGTLALKKSIEIYEADTSLIDRDDLSAIEFTLYAREDIIDAADGEVLCAANDVYGTYNLNEDGTLTVDKIPMGKYYLKETSVPAGFILDENEYDVLFELADKYQKTYTVTEEIENKVTKYEFYKKDIGGEEVEGAVITITDEEGNVVDTWSSTNEPHRIEGLEVGKTYTFKEDQSPNGYYYTVETEFTVVNEKEIQSVDIIDKKIQYQIVKVDDKDGSYVPGVTLKLTDKTTGVDVGTWLTEDEPIDVSELLIADHDYELEESEYVAGVYKATTIQFHVDKYNPASDEMITITMIDITTAVTVIKTDDTGKPLAGAEMQLFEAEKNEDGTYTIKDESAPVYEWISKTEPEDISDYVKGDEHYVVRESEAPFGLDVIKDIGFTVTGTQEQHQVILATDQRKDFYVAVTKIDAADESKKLKDAEITLFNADGSVAKDVNGKECKGITDGQGNIVFHVKYSDAGYYVQETAAPQGYRINKKHFDVVLAETYDFAANNPIKIVVNDEAAPATGASVPFVAGGVCILSLLAALLLNKKIVFFK